MRKPKVMPLQASNVIWAWMQRHKLPDNFLTDDVSWDVDREGYVFYYQDIMYLCTKEGKLKELPPHKEVDEWIVDNDD